MNDTFKLDSSSQFSWRYEEWQVFRCSLTSDGVNNAIVSGLLCNRDAQLYQMQVSSWMVHMESALSKGGSLVDDLNSRCILFIKVPFNPFTLQI